jgi:hypothetical protein
MATIDLSTFIGAVKPKERTRQYVILAAMFALGAHNVPVPARQISDMLKLHLGANRPRNLRGTLRAYKVYVSPADKGPPLRWSLTEKGVEQLRLLSGLALITTQSSSSFGSDIGIVCALEVPEFVAVQKAIGGKAAWREVGETRHTHVYRETTFKTVQGSTLRIVATTCTSMGLTAAAIATTHLINHFTPRLVAMIGIAAGTHSGNKQFGDILVADPSIDYNSGKIATEKGKRIFQPDPYPIGLNPRLRSVLQSHRGDDQLNPAKLAEVDRGGDGDLRRLPRRA